MGFMKRLFPVILLLTLLCCSILSASTELESETVREKRHHPEKHISSHHVFDFGHKVIHKTSDFKVGPDGVSHSKHFFVENHHPHNSEGHGSHYEENDNSHRKPNPFIDITHDEKHYGNRNPFADIYPKENKKLKAVTIDKYPQIKKPGDVSGHQFRGSDASNDDVDDRHNFDHLDYQGSFGINPRKLPEDFDDF